MTNAAQKLDITFSKLFAERKDFQVPAWLGDKDGNIKADNKGNVYVTFWNGETITVRNHSVPNQGRWVIVGYRNNVLQVLKSWDVFFDASLPDVVEHDHTWGVSTNPSWIRKQQILDGLAVPGTGLTIDFLGLEYYLNGAYHVIGYKNIDLTAQIPTSDARWCNVEVDEDGVISYNTSGTVKSSRELLLLEDIPATATTKKLLFSVRTHVGQVSFRKEPNDSDVFVPLFSGISNGDGGGGLIWQIITSDQSAAADNGYVANKATLLTLTLPTTSPVGKTIRVSGMGIGGWKIVQGTNQVIYYGDMTTTVGTGGYLASTHDRDAVELVCVVADREWNVVSGVGNITVV